MAELAEWDSFYVIVGSAAGTLIGLQFVVMTLVFGAAFATPTIVHFGTALLLSALVRAPWQSAGAIAGLWGAIGFAGEVYTVIVVRRMRRQDAYRPVFEDWLFHVLLPLVAYAMLVLAAFAASLHPSEALFGVGTAVLVLLFTGIHNAWDAVAYHVLHSGG